MATVVAVALLGLAACNLGSPAASVAPTPTPNSSSAAASLDCEEPNLLSPQGSRVDLTGTWTGGSTLFYVRQVGQCVWWIGLSNWPGQSPGDFFSNTFAGRLGVEGPDYVVRGEWASIIRPSSGMAYNPPYERLIAFEVVFETVGGTETIVLRGLRMSELAPTDWYARDLTRTGPLPDTQTP
ncbi:MAG: hypothetical protein AABM41_03835 [Chloroflexota bacterium]